MRAFGIDFQHNIYYNKIETVCQVARNQLKEILMIAFIFTAFVASVLLGATVHSALTKAPAWKTAISAALTLFSSLIAVRFCFIEFYGYLVKISEVLISYMK